MAPNSEELDQEGWNINLNIRELINLKVLSQNTGFNTLEKKNTGNDMNSLLRWLLKVWKKPWPTLSEV